jgi:hypothetical protein
VKKIFLKIKTIFIKKYFLNFWKVIKIDIEYINIYSIYCFYSKFKKEIKNENEIEKKKKKKLILIIFLIISKLNEIEKKKFEDYKKNENKYTRKNFKKNF